MVGRGHRFAFFSHLPDLAGKDSSSAGLNIRTSETYIFDNRHRKTVAGTGKFQAPEQQAVRSRILLLKATSLSPVFSWFVRVLYVAALAKVRLKYMLLELRCAYQECGGMQLVIYRGLNL